MKCTKCQADLPPQSRFCLKCGTPVQPAAAQPAPRAEAPAQPAGFAKPASSGLSKSTKAVIGMLCLAVAALGAVVVRSGLLHSAANTKNGTLVNAPGSSGNGSLVQMPGDSKNAPLVQAPGTSQAPPDLIQKPDDQQSPEDVLDYLRFLKEVEQRKMSLIKDFMATALMQSAMEKSQEAAAASSDEASKNFLPSMNKGFEQYPARWDQLAKYFLTRQPPASCAILQKKYYEHLGKVESMFLQVHNALAQANTDPGKALSALTEMQGKASAEADDTARQADDALGDVCDKYRIRKEFDIKTDSGSGSGLLR